MFSTIMMLSSQMTVLVRDMAVMKDHMQQSMLDSTLQLGNQAVPLIFGNATHQANITHNYNYRRSASICADANCLSDERFVKYAKSTQISTYLVIKHSLSAAERSCDNLVHLDEVLKASDVLTLANNQDQCRCPRQQIPADMIQQL